jgi:hypothetical protein
MLCQHSCGVSVPLVSESIPPSLALVSQPQRGTGGTSFCPWAINGCLVKVQCTSWTTCACHPHVLATGSLALDQDCEARVDYDVLIRQHRDRRRAYDFRVYNPRPTPSLPHVSQYTMGTDGHESAGGGWAAGPSHIGGPCRPVPLCHGVLRQSLCFIAHHNSGG